MTVASHPSLNLQAGDLWVSSSLERGLDHHGWGSWGNPGGYDASGTVITHRDGDQKGAWELGSYGCQGMVSWSMDPRHGDRDLSSTGRRHTSRSTPSRGPRGSQGHQSRGELRSPRDLPVRILRSAEMISLLLPTTSRELITSCTSSRRVPLYHHENNLNHLTFLIIHQSYDSLSYHYDPYIHHPNHSNSHHDHHKNNKSKRKRLESHRGDREIGDPPMGSCKAWEIGGMVPMR